MKMTMSVKIPWAVGLTGPWPTEYSVFPLHTPSRKRDAGMESDLRPPLRACSIGALPRASCSRSVLSSVL